MLNRICTWTVKSAPRLALLVGAQHTLLAPPLLTVFARGAASQFSGPANAGYQDAARCCRRITLAKTYRRAVMWHGSPIETKSNSMTIHLDRYLLLSIAP